MSRTGFVQLPRAVLYDPGLSPDAIVSYAVMLEAAKRDDRTLVRISMATIAAGLRRSRKTLSTPRRAIRELVSNGHVVVIEAPSGGCFTFRLNTHSEIAPGTNERPIAKSHPTHSEIAPGTRGEIAPLRKRTVDGININYVRTASRERNAPANCPLSDELIELLLAFGWSSEKIHREARTIHGQIGGRQRESVLIQQIRHARAEPSIKDPFAYALSKVRRECAGVAS
jgi:hypothetical protein